MPNFGLSAFDHLNDESYKNVSSNILERQSLELEQQLEVFQGRLIDFAKKHNKDLKANPEFRSRFLRMCSSIGIDPLEIFEKDQHLFNVDDFYYEISVKIIEVCRETKDMNGGVISFDELRNGYFKNLNVTMEDLEKSIDMIQVLDGGFKVFSIRGKKFLRSVPNEITGDQTKILEVCSIMGYASISLLRANFQWDAVRGRSVLEDMAANGMLWIDNQAGNEILYWDPSWIMRS
ncbi:Vacuolar-sorting protein SNF8 [Nakaseomyces glabratus]|uniref:Vacuolar-sorting protein SNF8 n=1 Tax=Candida glabrata TaxID=5478 RepID=A0A0W0EGN7_CANGB|nr:EAP30/Vps36 family [Nakaseomyces glabratus]KAH7581663.1 EAP30/Vps36 family [Nakaseomyces glabratus]KAH7582616.1 EAP30/Vps36 family [Nakaseomyces glabratus]KAH7595225.1 EAP30/Vps36 family [Nakaseomyces glabratus]KAH7611309.1 EAP30/Vps36 family [Nakaseomyces glabratus]